MDFKVTGSLLRPGLTFDFAGFENDPFLVQVVHAGDRSPLTVTFISHGFEIISVSDHTDYVTFETVGAFVHSCWTRPEVKILVGAIRRRRIVGDVSVNGDLFALPLSFVRDGLFDQFNQTTSVFVEEIAGGHSERHKCCYDQEKCFISLARALKPPSLSLPVET